MDAEVDIASAVDELVDEYRVRCLWSLSPDYYPRTLRERLHVLAIVQRYGDLAAYRRASQLREWLSQNSSEESVAF